MGVYARRHGRKITYYATFMVGPKGARYQEQELVGPNKEEARRVEAQRKREVRDGTYSPEHKTGAVTVDRYAKTWGDGRKNKTAGDDRSRLRDHVLPAIGSMQLRDVRPKHIRAAIEGLKAKAGIGPKTIRNVYGTLRALFRDAVIEELIVATPCVLPPGVLPAKPRKVKAIYEKADVVKLLTSPRVPWDRRVVYALAFFTGMRHGEIAGRRWRDWDPKSSPLGCLAVDTQYNDEPLKSPDGEVRPRRVPVHPELAKILAEWKLSGFARFFGKAPRPDDFIVPTRGVRNRCRAVRRSLHNLQERDCPNAGVAPLTFHRSRDTYISLTRRDGARKDVLERVTHNAAGDVFDQYTLFDWLPLCEAVSCLRLSLDGGQVVALPIAAAGGSSGHDGFHDGPKSATRNQVNSAANSAGRTGLEDVKGRGKAGEGSRKAASTPLPDRADSSAFTGTDQSHDGRHGAEEFQAAVAEHAERVEADRACLPHQVLTRGGG